MQITPGVLLSGAAALVTTGVAVLAWERRVDTASVALSGFGLAVAIWTGGNLMQSVAVHEATKLFWVNVQYVGIAALPVTTFAFATAINGLDRWTRSRRLALLAAPMVAVVLLSWTNGYHHLVRETVSITSANGAVRLQRVFGPAFWAGWAYSNLLLLIATLLVLRAVVYAQEIIKRRTVALIVGATVPWGAHFLYLSGVIDIEPEAFFAVTGVAFAYATLRYRTADLRPVARDAVLDLLDDGVLVVDGDDRILDCNDAARQLFGERELVGESIESIFADMPDLLECYRRGETDDVEIEHGGETRHVQLMFADDSTGGETPLELPGGTEYHVIVLRDVTPIRERERRLERQNERLERVRSALAHDLRNPLNVAAGYLAMAREGDEDALDGIERAHDRMAELIDDVLTLAESGTTGETERVDLNDAIREAWTNVETGEAELAAEADATVEADRGQLRQLLENLVRNATEHAGPDTTVRIGGIEDTVRSNDDRTETVGFYVEDDGPGIPEEERSQVFEHGYSGSDGTGFGLAIVEEIARAHGWGVRLTEGESGGARFEFVVDE